MRLRRQGSSKPWCLKKYLTESAWSMGVDLLMSLEAEAAFREENPHEFIKYSATGLDLGDGFRVLEATDDVDDNEQEK